MNPNKGFEDSIRTTRVPGNPAPRNTREAFSVYKVYENGIFEIEDDVKNPKAYDRSYIFTDINFANQNDDDKLSVLSSVAKFLNYMSCDFKITVANLHRDMSEYIKTVFNDTNCNRYPEISKGIRAWIEEKMEDADIKNNEKCFLLTVTARTYSYDEARSYFLGLDAELEHFFNDFKSLIVPLKAEQRLNIIRRFFYRESGEYRFNVGDPMYDVIPVSYQGYKDFMIFNENKYVSVLFARSYNSSLDPNEVIYGLAKMSYTAFCTMDYAPVDDAIFKAKLNSANLNNERNITQEIDRKRASGQLLAGVSYSRQKYKDELEEYMDQVDDNSERCIQLGLLLVITAEDEDELARRIESVKARGKELGVFLEIYNQVQLKAFNTALPIGCRLVKKMRSFLTSSIVTLQPFHAFDLNDEGGFFYGINRTTKGLIFANRKKLKSPHGMIIGYTGTGKSYIIKETEVAQTLLSTDDDLQMIDPQNEMEAVCAAYGGTFLNLSPQGTVYVNPMEVSSELYSASKESKESFIASVSDWANSFVAATMQNMLYTQEHRAFVGRAVRNIYEQFFNNKRAKQPTLVDLRNEIHVMEEKADNNSDAEKMHTIYNSLEEFTVGVYDMFAHESNINIDNERFVVFGLANVNKDLWEPTMITVMFYLAQRMEYNQKLRRATRFVIDEAQVVAANEMSADILLKAVVTYRKFGGIVTLALQNLKRAVENEQLRDMFSNCGYKCFLDQGGIDANALAEIQSLTDIEYDSLSEERNGCGVMIWGKKVVLFEATMSDKNCLYKTFNTNFHEKAEAVYEDTNQK